MNALVRRLGRAGLLTEVQPPTPADEAVRDLSIPRKHRNHSTGSRAAAATCPSGADTAADLPAHHPARASPRRNSHATSSPVVATRTHMARPRRRCGSAPASRARASAPVDAPPSARSPVARSRASSRGPSASATNRSFLCASMPTYVVTCFMTGSLRCGSGSRALTRDLVALTTVLSAARHHNVTMESRSFHIV